MADDGANPLGRREQLAGARRVDLVACQRLDFIT